MQSHYNQFVSEIRDLYENTPFNGLLNATYELQKMHALIPNLERSHTMAPSTRDSIIQAISHAAKLGLSLCPDKGLATLSMFKPVNNGVEFYLDVSLVGIEVTMSRIRECTISTLDVVTGDDGISWNGNVFGATFPVRAPVKNEMLKGAICIIEVPNHDQLVTTITIRELKELSRLSCGDLKALTPDFAKRHVFKRALKTLIAPPQSLLSELQQATKSLDIALFSHDREFVMPGQQ